ncbi:mitochondrial inner membrane protease subunit 1 [Eupeodes corollae]|uniref:mitochondrial inner membrane protease subunit 1 n=1 Tax=Eupeodes corollae TaxID=290404 RepID=UPI0024925CF9|nr:mitochondrial inner membrane protease subunit 1 [Eupeodes corollae]
MTLWISRILGFTRKVIIYGCVTHCTFEYLGDVVICNGPSMEPTLYSNDILLTERISPRFSNISRGDIIIAKCPTNPSVHICKRVIGMAGDKVTTSDSYSGRLNHEVNVNGLEDSENDCKRTPRSVPKKIVAYVPKGQVWVEGDNKSNSTDSRFYGSVPEGLVQSRVLCRLWPINEIKMLT